MQAEVYQLVLPPVANNWKWVSDTPHLLTLIACKWSTLTVWGVISPNAAELPPQSQTLAKYQAHAMLHLTLDNLQTELTVQLVTMGHTYRYTLKLNPPQFNLPQVNENLSFYHIQALANSLVDWMADMLEIDMPLAAAQYTVVPEAEVLNVITHLNQHSHATTYASPVHSGHNFVFNPLWLQHYPDCHALYRALAAKALQGRMYGEAVQYYQQAIQTTPKVFAIQRAKDACYAGLTAQLAGQAMLAQRWLACAVDWSPELTMPHLHLGITLEGMEKLEEAVAPLEVFHASLPLDLRPIYSLIRVYSQLEQWPKVIALYKKLDAITPLDEWLKCDMAYAYLQANDCDRGFELFRELSQSSAPDHPVVEMARLALGEDIDSIHTLNTIL
jgi:tetratricopeptide (TPR) repeat protein